MIRVVLLELASLAIVPALLYALPAIASHDDAIASFTYLGLIPCFVFYLMSSLYALLDFCAPRAWLTAHKFQRSAGIVAPGAYTSATLVSLKSWLAVGLPWAYLVASRLAPARGSPRAADDWAPSELLLHLIPFIVIVDLVFYSTHRLLHTPALYAAVHKTHHSFAAPFALAAVYAHPLEHLLSNVLSISAGPLLLGSHPATACAWACIAIVSTTGAHSGFRLPWTKPQHDFHHESFNFNFGAGLGLFDLLLGTRGSSARR